MTCGIYRLTFSSGNTYIGKSIDIENRWKQHYDKFRKGTAAKAMQHEYNNYGVPNTEIIYTCHEDHIDIVEESLIYRLKPTLNGTSGRDRLKHILHSEAINESGELENLLTQSTMDHIGVILNCGKRLTSLANLLDDLSKEIKRLYIKRTEEEVAYDIMGKVKSSSAEAQGYKSRMLAAMNTLETREEQLDSAQAKIAELKRYIDLPWWKKVF